MKSIQNSGKAQTVLGPIGGDELGFTLTHEHILSDFSFRVNFALPEDPEEKDLPSQPITLENLGWIRSHRFSNVDNLRLDNEETAIYETMRFKKAGGNTIVEVTPNHVGRNPSGLARVAQATGINIIMGTSYYIAESHRPEMKMNSKTEEDIAREFIKDITTGVDDTGIRAGIIGEIACTWPLQENERKALRGAALAQQRTGAAISAHPGVNQDSPFEIIGVLKDAGADLGRVIMCHITSAFPISARSVRRKLAEMGCYLEYDMFGADGHLPRHSPYDVAADSMRISQIIELIEDGYLNQILISQDVFYKISLSRYGGFGYDYILKTILPIMRSKGLTDEQIHTITAENPKRFLTFA